MVPVMIAGSVFSFAIIFLLPGDPALLMRGDQLASNREVYEAKRAELGLDRPVPIQYLDWLGKTPRGGLGASTPDKLPVPRGTADRLPVTPEPAEVALVLALSFALPSGIISAPRPTSSWALASP